MEYSLGVQQQMSSVCSGENFLSFRKATRAALCMLCSQRYSRLPFQFNVKGCVISGGQSLLLCYNLVQKLKAGFQRPKGIIIQSDCSNYLNYTQVLQNQVKIVTFVLENHMDPLQRYVVSRHLQFEASRAQSSIYQSLKKRKNFCDICYEVQNYVSLMVSK